MNHSKVGSCLILILSLITLSRANEENDENAMVDYLSKNNYLQGKAEIIFLLDRSGSVGRPDFEIEIGFVQSFLSHIVVDVNASRVAVISYSDTAKRHIDYLKEPKSKCFLSQQLHDIVYEDSGATNIVSALEEARDIFRNARPNVNKVIVLISDGLANKGGNPVETAKQLKSEGVQIFCFGVGRYIRTELESLASNLQNVFVCKGFREFERLAKKIRGDPHELSWSSRTTKPSCDYLCDSIYRGEANDPGCCDPDAQCSCALLSGVHTCVCNPGYYGLSGLIGNCKACLRGTYKSKLEPSNSCLPCPLHSTTAHIASIKLSDCYCKEGYIGDPSKGIPCKAVDCPPLQAPTNGHILGICEDSYGSTCHFMCRNGYELVDPLSDVRTCQSNGKWTGQTAVCQEVRCNSLHNPKYGSAKCDPYPLTVGKKCSFKCQQGYVIQGSTERICASSKMWTGTKTSCIPLTCEVLPRLDNGRYLNCEQKPTYNQVCFPSCHDGFERQGPQYLICKENGKLVDGKGLQTKPHCKDKFAPVIACPHPIEIETDAGKDTATVNWEIPHPSDNSGFMPKLTTNPLNIIPPRIFPIGDHVFQYIAVDLAGLNSSCSMHIKVIDKEKPVILSCPSDVEVSTNDAFATVFWEEPQFQDNSKKPLFIKKTANPGDVFKQGSRTVYYDAYDESKNRRTCEFLVTVSRSECPYYPPPVNGAIACDDLMYGQMCQVFCNNKFDFTSKPANWYICNTETQWETFPENMVIPWPDCAKPVLPGAVRQMLDLYYKGDCKDPMVQRYIKKLFLNHITQSVEYSHLCNKPGICSINAIEVRCGRTSGVKRKKRNVWQHAEKEQLEVEFEITINTDQEFNDTEAILQDFLKTISDFKWDLNDELIFTSTLLPIENTEEREASEILVVVDEITTLVCKSGSVLIDDKCVLCSFGTFYNPATKECVDCPIGYYQEHQGQQICEKCPEGTSTEHARTKNETLCKAICVPGTYSSTGLETCISCPLQKYQDSTGMTTCYDCPNGTTTENVGAISIKDCKDGCSPGSFSQNGLEPCAACPLHQYQPLYGQTECLECPGHLSTDKVGATAVNECIDIDPCLVDDTCLNNGTCTRDGRNADCKCMPGFDGTFCEKDIDECSLNSCSNGGQCINTEGSFYCKCSDGFSGPLCDVEIDECASDPCQNNGTCIDRINGYACVCSYRYEGLNCEIERELCFKNVACLNGGVCMLNDNDSFSFCECESGFAGIDCSQNINDCENVTCKNGGSCIDGINSFTCVCPSGYAGVFCEIDINECENNTCLSGSTCEDLVGAYRCLCPPGWNGTNCENKMDSDFILMFPESTATIANMASLKMNAPLADATISLWIQTNDTERSGTPLSYAVASTRTTSADGSIVDNALTISDCADVKIYVNNQPVATDVQVADGQWHHLAFTWSSENSGTWALYKDGELKHEGKHLHPHEIIDGGGNMVIGQEQDTIGGGFSPLETFTGNITRVNIWNKYFVKSNITRLCSMDDDIPDKVVAWPDFLQGLQGSVNILRNSRPTVMT